MELNVNIFETKQIVDEKMKRGGGGCWYQMYFVENVDGMG